MSSTKGTGGRHGGHGGGNGGKKKAKENKKERGECSKCANLLPMMYKMKDILAKLKPECERYRLELAAVKSENEKLRRQLGMPLAAREAAMRAAAQTKSSSSTSAGPARNPAMGSASKERSTGRKGGAAATTTTAAASKKRTKSAAPVYSDASNEERKKLSSSSGVQGTGLIDSKGLGSGRSSGGGGVRVGEEAGSLDVAAAAAATAATARKDRSKGDKVRDWTAAVARQKREKERADGFSNRTGAADESNDGANNAGGSNVGGGGRGKMAKSKSLNGEAAATAVPPTGVFAAAEFSFLAEGKEQEEVEEEMDGSDEGGEEDDHDENENSNDDSRQKPRKRARTTAGSAGDSSKGRGGRNPASGGAIPRTLSMLARGFRPQPKSLSQIEDEVEQEGGDDDGWGEQEEEQKDDVEWYEDSPDDMDGLGWSQVWRRGDAMTVGGEGGGGDGVGDGLDKGSRAMAKKCCKLVGTTPAASEKSGGILGPESLRALLRLELTGAVSMEGVLVSVLRGRSLKRDEGFLGRLALQLLSGIDGAHTSPLSDPSVLTLVVEELEGLAEVLAAPSTPALRGFGWARETQLGMAFLTRALIGWMDQAAKHSGADAEEDEDNLGGYASMSFGNSKKKNAKAQKGPSNTGRCEGNGGEKKEGRAWAAETEVPVLWWWDTDEAARVPWGVARLLGLLLRRLDQPQRTQAVLHSILVRSLGGPARLLRFPLAFLEAFPGFLCAPHLPLAEQEGERVTELDGNDILAPGLWRRAVTAALFPTATPGGGSFGSCGVGRENGGVVVGGSGRAATMSNRFKLVCFGGDGGGGGSSLESGGDIQLEQHGGGARRGRGETAAELGEKILQAISFLHKPAEGGEFGENVEHCELCRGGGGRDGGACGSDDALAMSTGLGVLVEGAYEFSDVHRCVDTTELAIPRSRGELLAVEAVRALRILAVGMESGGFPIERCLVPVINRVGVCPRSAALACHALAQSAARGREAGGRGRYGVVHTTRMLSDGAARVARTLMNALQPDPEAEKWEAGQLDEGAKLPHGAKAQAACALLSLLEGRDGDAAAENERSIVEWTQGLKPTERLSTPLPLLLSVTSLLSRPPAHVINLSRRPHRWKTVSDMARQRGVWLYRHDAVDWKAVEASSMSDKAWISEKEVALTWATELNTMHDKDCEKATTLVMHPSERACAASHLNLWTRHRDGKLAPFMPDVHPDAVLILEDDAKLEPRFLECAKAAMLHAASMHTDPKKNTVGLKKEWDIIYLGHILPVPIMEGIFFAAKRNNIENTGGVERGEDSTSPVAAAGEERGASGTPPPGSSLSGATADARGRSGAATALGLVVAPVTFAWGLHAYLLTRAAAARLVGTLPVSAPADIFVASLLTGTDSGRPVLAGRAVLPALATTAGGAADTALSATLGENATEVVGDVVSTGTRRAGAANGVWSMPGMGQRFGRKGTDGGGGAT